MNIFLRALVVSLVGCWVLARGAELGDPAAPLRVAEWVKGGPVDVAGKKGEAIHVVEFWATWCPPCRTSIPHLTRLQQKYRSDGVVVVGVTDEEGPVVREFVKELGGQMEYVVARDAEGATGEAYMGAYGIGGIPHAFIVDRGGRVVWNGHPEDGLDKALGEVVGGTFDLALARKRDRGRKLLGEFYELSGPGRNPDKAAQLAGELAVLDKEVGGLVPGEAFDGVKLGKAARFEYLLNAYEEAFQSGASEEETARLGRDLGAVAPAGFEFADFTRSLRLGRLFDQYYKAATEGLKEESDRLAGQMVALGSTNALMMNDIAWTMLTDEDIKHRDPASALVLARRAFEVSGAESSNIADTYARALFDTGKREEAIRYQEKALALCDDAELKKELQATLERYREGR